MLSNLRVDLKSEDIRYDFTLILNKIIIYINVVHSVNMYFVVDVYV